MYYYKSYREGGRVKTRYYGAGDLAEVASLLDDEGREARRESDERRRAEAAELGRVTPIDRLIAAYGQAVDTVVAEVLEAAGYRRHNRGEWRKRRA